MNISSCLERTDSAGGCIALAHPSLLASEQIAPHDAMHHRPDGVPVGTSLLHDLLDGVPVGEFNGGAGREDQQIRGEVARHLIELLSQ